MDSDKQPKESPPHSRPADVYDLLAWLEVNKKKVAIGVTLVVIAGFALAIYRYTAEQKALKASDALLALKPALVSPTNNPPAQPSAFFKVAEEYKGTSAAERAHFYGATLLFQEGKYGEAETQFNRFLQEYPDSPWSSAATYGIATSQEAAGKSDALTAYQNVFARYPQSAEADLAKMAVARIYEGRNQPEQALRIYNELSASTATPGSMSPMSGMPGNPEAFQKKEALLRKYPNLKTNVPAISGATSAPVSLGAITNPLSNPAPSINTNTVPSPK